MPKSAKIEPLLERIINNGKNIVKSLRALFCNHKLEIQSSEEIQIDKTTQKMSPPRTRTLAVPIVKFEDFVNAGGNPKEFWAQPGVKRKLGTVWLSIENLEESACDNQAGIEMIPASLTKVANTIGVSPEMICDWIGQDIVYRRRLNRNKMKIAPNGVAISMRPKYEEFIDNECGKAGDFWNQVYVKNIVKEAQMSKVPRVVAAEKLGVKVGTLVEVCIF